MMSEQNDDNVYGYYTGCDLIHSDLSLLERTLMGAIRSLCDGYSKATPGSLKYGGVWFELDTACAKRINIPVVSVRKARRSLQNKGWLKGSKMWHGRCNVKMSPKWYAKREIAEGLNMDWTDKGDQIDHSDTTDHSKAKADESDTTDHLSDTGDHYNQSIQDWKKEACGESVFALEAQPSLLREQTPNLNSTLALPAKPEVSQPKVDIIAQQYAKAQATLKARAEGQAKLGLPSTYPQEPAPSLPPTTIPMPTNFPLETAPLPEVLPFNLGTTPVEQPTPVYPVPPEPTESCRAILERIKVRLRPTTVPPTANVEVATAVNAPSLITKLRTGMIKQRGSGNDSAQLEAKPETVTGPEYRPSSIGFCMESAMDCIKASDAPPY